MKQYPVLYYFLSDLCHQILFYFGGVVSMAILLWEKATKKPMNWRWVSAFFLFCVFVACFQGFVDEHSNSGKLIEEKSRLSSENYRLQQKVDSKQFEVDYLRDHQHLEVSGIAQPDPLLAKVLQRISSEENAQKNEPTQRIQKGLAGIAQEILQDLTKERAASDQANNALTSATSGSMAFRAATTQEKNAIWDEQTTKMEQSIMQSDGLLRNAMMSQYSPRVIALLEQLKTNGQSAIPNSEIDSAVQVCTVLQGGMASYQAQRCAQSIGVIAQRIH